MPAPYILLSSFVILHFALIELDICKPFWIFVKTKKNQTQNSNNKFKKRISFIKVYYFMPNISIHRHLWSRTWLLNDFKIPQFIYHIMCLVYRSLITWRSHEHYISKSNGFLCWEICLPRLWLQLLLKVTTFSKNEMMSTCYQKSPDQIPPVIWLSPKGRCHLAPPIIGNLKDKQVWYITYSIIKNNAIDS
jgi:hypothetical protein